MRSRSLDGVRCGLGVAGLLLAGVPALAAQSARRAAPSPQAESAAAVPASARHGMWLSAGLGAGSASLHCRICDGEQQSRGTAGYVRVGTTLNPYFLLGGEINGWMRSDQAGSQRVVSFTGNAYWYPSPRHGYYVKGGLGVARYRQWETENSVTNALAAGGFTGQAGVGYEVRVNPGMSIVPYFNLIGSARGSIATERDDGTHFDRDRLSTKANVLLLQLGLGVTWH
jgi:hypothetical protein